MGTWSHVFSKMCHARGQFYFAVCLFFRQVEHITDGSHGFGGTEDLVSKECLYF
jgi:hypothetical protein